jgi:hypothetical protein
MEPSPLAALYNAAPIILWVEDLVTSVYLRAVWQYDRRFQLYVGGGHEVLAAVVEDACRSGRSHVYGMRDRDFGPTNRPRWKQADVSIFALETFEIECFLLDPAALASCAINTAGKTEAWLDDHLRAQAQTLLWWMACRKVLADLREARQAKFPSHPKRGQVATQEDAERVLLDNEWVMVTAPGLSKKVAGERLRAALHDAHSHYAELFHQERKVWTQAFSGKELLEELVSWIFTKGRPPRSAALQDLAKAVAQEQISSGNEPKELLELRDAMLARLPTPLPRS